MKYKSTPLTLVLPLRSNSEAGTDDHEWVVEQGDNSAAGSGEKLVQLFGRIFDGNYSRHPSILKNWTIDIMAILESTPGVYINEVDAFPSAAVPVATAVPAFIGYTPTARYQGCSYLNRPTLVTSFAEFQAIFMLPDPPAPADPATQYRPEYYLVAQPGVPSAGRYVRAGDRYYSVLPDPNTIYYLYNSVRMFFQNGGGNAYIVSVGTYGSPSGRPLADATVDIVNANVLPANTWLS